jgi:hypothetical protein
MTPVISTRPRPTPIQRRQRGLTVIALVGLAFALGFLAGRLSPDAPLAPVAAPPAAPPAAATTAAAAVPPSAPPLVAAHYFGRQWPKNFIAGFRRADVAEDFAALRAEGFNTVVLLVAWGDFQPGYAPCCTWDERAFERLRFLLDRAQDAGLGVVVRLGYGWYFHPGGGDPLHRVHRLMNEAPVRQAFFAFSKRIAAVAAAHPATRLTLLSWEDLWLRRIEPGARGDYREFLASLADDDPLRSELPADGSLPTAEGAHAAVFHRYWDWLLTDRLFPGVRQHIQALTLEARIDRDPLPVTAADGSRSYRWIGHEASYSPHGAAAMSLYWAPFWGAENRGETLSAARAAELFTTLLAEASAGSGGSPLFVDQFNVIDNTLGHAHNASLAAQALPDFMTRAGCALHRAKALGYGYWSVYDYAESPLYNPTFGYGLDGWQLDTGDRTPASTRLHTLDSGDQQLRLVSGDRLSQTIPATRGRLPQQDSGFDNQVCLHAVTDTGAVIHLSAGGEAVTLHLPAGHRGEACTAIAPTPDAHGLELTLSLDQGRATFNAIALFDHVQTGGVHDRHGQALPLREPLLALNRRFAAGDFAACQGPGSAVLPQ